MTSDRVAAAAKVIDTEHIKSMRNMRLPNPSKLARALDAAGLLAPNPVSLDEEGRNFVIDCLIDFRQRANILGTAGMTEAWEAAANAFSKHTTTRAEEGR